MPIPCVFLRGQGFEPVQSQGGQFTHSSTGLQIAAYLLPRALGTNFVDPVQWHVLDPLGLDSAGFWCRLNPSPGGAVNAIPADYVHFLEAFLPRSKSAYRLFGPRAPMAIREIVSDQIGQGPVLDSPYFDLIGDQAATLGSGLGFWIEVADADGRSIRFTASDRVTRHLALGRPFAWYGRPADRGRRRGSDGEYLTGLPSDEIVRVLCCDLDEGATVRRERAKRPQWA